MKTRFEQFIKELNDEIDINYKTIENIFNLEYGYPELDPLRDEICKCIICGLNQAAITLTNHLLEASLKKCLAMKYSITNKKAIVDLKDAFKDGIIKFDSKNLFQTIDKASEQDLITKEQKKRLLEFKDKFRNPYSHATSAKIFEEAKIKGTVISLQEGERGEDLIKRIFQTETNEMMSIKDILPIQGIAQTIFAKEDIVPYFTEIDEIIREMLKRLKPNS